MRPPWRGDRLGLGAIQMMGGQDEDPAVARNIWLVESITAWTWTSRPAGPGLVGGQALGGQRVQGGLGIGQGAGQDALGLAVFSHRVVMIEVAKAAAVVRRKLDRPAAEAVSSAAPTTGRAGGRDEEEGHGEALGQERGRAMAQKRASVVNWTAPEGDARQPAAPRRRPGARGRPCRPAGRRSAT